MDFQILFSLAAASLIFLILVLRITKGSNALNLPPGPPKLPLIGNIHQLVGSISHRALRDLARKYGPIMHLKLGQVSTVVVSSPQLAREVMTTHDISFADRPKTEATDIFLYKSQDIGWSPYGAYWREMKKLCTTELLSARKVQSFSSIRQEELSRIRKHLQSSTGLPINFGEMTIQMINNVICKATIGSNCKEQSTLVELLDYVTKNLSSFNISAYFPRLRLLSVIAGKRSQWLKMQQKIDKILEYILEEHKTRQGITVHGQEDLVDILLTIKGSNDLEFPMSYEHVKAVLMDMFIGGTESSAATIEWAMAEMMRNPRVMKKVQGELREALNGKTTITDTDIQDLHYLKLVIKETLRLHAPAQVLLPRECRQQCKIGGYDIPAKTTMLINALACATDPQYWDNPESFMPERFENSAVNFVGTNFEFIPFGSGRRICPGITFALSLVEHSLAELLYHFNWQLPNGLKPEELDMTEVSGLATRLKSQLHVIPTPNPFVESAKGENNSDSWAT